MAQCKLTAQDFIQSTFSPQVAVLCSSDAELLCQKNNLSFVQLVQPFCRLTTEAHIRDPNNVAHTLQNLRISMVDMNSHTSSPAAARKIMNDAVNNAQLQMAEGNRGNVMTIGNYDLQLSASTPWFEAYRECFLKFLPPSDHEFLKHCLGCVFVVSSNHQDPLGMFSTLSSSQQQQQTQFPNKLPHWFCPNILKYYVLVHDVVEVETSKAEAIYQSMKSTFGHQSCHLLQINSRSLTALSTMTTDANLPDPWSQFLTKQPETVEGVDYDGSASGSVEDLTFPTRLVEGPPETTNHRLDPSQEVTEDGFGTNNDIIDHPLALSDQSSLEGNHIDDFAGDYKGSNLSLNSTDVGVTKSLSFIVEKGKPAGHGMCLTTSDQDRIRIFIHEFAVRALLPWAERQMKLLSDVLASKTGIRKSLFSATKKFFGGNPSKASHATTNLETTVVYSKDSAELQMRRLADLAFLFHLYDFAYQTYHTAKRDFNNDHAWLHYAGALEMACIAIFMLGSLSQRPYPYHYMESAITTYLQSCKNHHYAVRATLVSTEALKNRGMYNEAAMQFIKMMSEDSDLRSALLLEQAAHCFINMKTPMVRKYSFHMILAGHRFSKAGQRKHALRAYSQALQIYKGKNWSLAEDHINFTIGRQSHNLKQLENATAAFKHLLTENSKQTATQQNAFLREYLFVYRQLLMQEAEGTSLQPGTLPELPLPALDSNATKVLLGAKPQPPQGDKVFATGVWFDHQESQNPRWIKLEELLVSSANNGTIPVTHRPSLQCYTNKTDNKYSPMGYMREPITVEIYLVNPLKVTLTLTDVMLLWSFLPTIASHDKPQAITNEHLISAKNKLADEIIHTQVINEIILQGNDRLPVQLTLVPQQMGDLRIVGVTYNLGSSSTTFMAPSQGPGGLLGGTVGPKASYVSTVHVRGKQRLEVQGPRLNSKKEEMAYKVYGPDRRLDLVIQQEMPLLQASFVNFPKTLLCGEVHPVSLNFTNMGSSPLHNLKVALSNPKFFTLGDHSDIPKFSGVYHIDNNKSSNCQSCTSADKDFTRLSRVMDINIPGGTLHPKSTVTVPAWVRGNDIGGIHEVNFLFYYEPAQQMPKVRHRLLRHTVLVNMIESLSVRAVAQRASKYSPEEQTDNVGDCLVSCEMENLSQTHVQKTHVKEVHITQISCASQTWTLRCLSSHSQNEIRIGSRETLQVCLKAEMLPQTKDPDSNKLSSNHMVFTDIPFNSQQIQSHRPPCSDFYKCSQVRLKPLEEDTFQSLSSSQVEDKTKPADDFSSLNNAIELGFTLIILWQAHVISDRGEDMISLGQHHVTIDKADNIFTSYPFVLVQKERPPIKFIRDDEPSELPKPPAEVVTQLVVYSLQHQTNVDNCFTKFKVCCVPVTLILHNSSDGNITVLVDTSKAQQRLNEYQETNQAMENTTDGFTWVGQTLKQFQLSASEERSIPLTVCFDKPGVYNINNLAVFVTYKDDASEMTLQKQTKPSVIVINDVS